MYPVHPFPFSTELEGAQPLRFCQRVGSYDRTATNFPVVSAALIAPAHHAALQASMEGRFFSVRSKALPNQTTSLPPEARESIHASVSSAPWQASAHTPPRRVAFLDPQSNFVSS